ncbi:MAG: hypothetical protein IT372_35835 [Polyangiaceae bacterium]|nr:hypothetical protein [Polyangiaceae bacterium]
MNATPAPPPEGSPLAGVLLVVLVDDPAIDDQVVDATVARVPCAHAMVRIPAPREDGYAWQERHLKPALVALLQEHLGADGHPLAPLGIAGLPVRQAAALTADVLELVELREAAAEPRLARAGEGTSPADYERSLLVVAGERLASRLLRLRPDQVELALDVVTAEGVGTWTDERFRLGAEALQEVGLARVIEGSVSLGPLSRRAPAPGVAEVLLEKIPEPFWTERARERLGKRPMLGEALRSHRDPRDRLDPG